MARKLIAPFTVLAVTGLLAFTGLKTESFGLSPHNACAFGLADMDAPPPDILFLGNSRFGAAVDPGYLDRRIGELAGRPLRVERLALTKTNIPGLRILSERYLKRRGAPDALVLQLTYSLSEARYAEVTRPIHPDRNVSYGDFEQLYRMQMGALLNDKQARLPLEVERQYRTLPAVFVDHVVAGIRAALRIPGSYLIRGTLGCQGGKQQLLQQSNVWLYNSIGNDMPLLLISPEEIEEARAKSGKLLSFMPKSRHRRFESDQFKKLIATWTDAGTAVFLSYIPGVTETPIQQSDLGEINTVFPNTTYLPLNKFEAFREKVGHAALYRDENHVNIRGATEITEEFAQLLAGALE